MSGQDHICFDCVHFRATAPLTFGQPGYCSWQPVAPAAWLAEWVSTEGDYYGPKRDVYRSHPPDICEAKKPTRAETNQREDARG